MFVGVAIEHKYPTTRFRVERMLVGQPAGEIRLGPVAGPEAGTNPVISSNCDLGFVANERYLVYARRNSQGDLVTSMRSRTRRASDPQAAVDLAYFDARDAGRPTSGWLSGVVLERHYDSSRGPDGYVRGDIVRPVSGVRVTATSTGGESRTTTTTDRGWYAFSGLALSWDWRVQADLPAPFVPHDGLVRMLYVGAAPTVTWFKSASPTDRLARVFDTRDGRPRGVVNGRLVVSDDGGVTWKSSGLDRDVLSLVRIGTTWYAGTAGGLSAGAGGGVFRSSDLSTWVECSSGLSQWGGPVLATGDGDLLVYSTRSTDGCRSWWEISTRRPMVSNYDPAGALVFRTPSGHVLTLGRGITRFDLTTRTWELVKEPDEITVASAAEGGGRYWMGTDHGVYMLAVDGKDWEVWPMGLDGERILSLTVDPKGYLLASVEGRGLFRAALP